MTFTDFVSITRNLDASLVITVLLNVLTHNGARHLADTILIETFDMFSAKFVYALII